MNILTSPLIRRASCAAALIVSALLAGCGGGTQVSHFQPQRLVVFGDEYSAVDDGTNGLTASASTIPTPTYTSLYDGTTQALSSSQRYYGIKYSVNALYNDSPSTSECNAYPLWTQQLASYFGFYFPQCSLGYSSPNGGRAVMLAAAGQTASQVITKIAQYVSSTGVFSADQADSSLTTPGTGNTQVTLQSGDLVTVMAGANDVLAAYLSVKNNTSTFSAQENALKALGRSLGQSINTIVSNGQARVLVVTVPDLGLSPIANADNNNPTDTTYQIAGYTCGDNPNGSHLRMLSILSDCFNTGLRLGIVNNGFLIGLVTADTMVRNIAINPSGNGGFIDESNPACEKGTGNASAALCAVVFDQITGAVDSTTQLVNSDSTQVTYHLWAYDIWFTYGGSHQLYNLVINQFNLQPF